MSKRKHPTKKSLRQGQTIYIVSTCLHSFGGPAEITTYHMHSHNTPLPEPGFVIDKMPVHELRERLDLFGNDIYCSRRKAETARKRLNNQKGN